eukprot:1251722-Pleurochrysis_carterae.AAC.1
MRYAPHTHRDRTRPTRILARIVNRHAPFACFALGAVSSALSFHTPRSARQGTLRAAAAAPQVSGARITVWYEEEHGGRKMDVRTRGREPGRTLSAIVVAPYTHTRAQHAQEGCHLAKRTPNLCIATAHMMTSYVLETHACERTQKDAHKRTQTHVQ